MRRKISSRESEAGLPKGVFNVVTGSAGEIGSELTANPIVKKLSFTGSTEVGKVLMTQGEGGRDMMVLIAGSVAIERDGQRVNTLGAGDFFGEISLIDGGPRTATVTTEEPSWLLVITHRDFHAMMEEFPDVENQVLSALAHRIRRHEPEIPH